MFQRKLFILFFLTLVFSFLAFINYGSLISAATLTDIWHYPSGGCNTGVGCQATEYYVTFTMPSSLPVDGKIKVTFPSGFNVSAATLGGWSGFDGNKSLSISGQTLTVTRTGGGTVTAPDWKWLRFTGIVNPITPGYYALTLETTNSSNVSIDGPTLSAENYFHEIKDFINFPFSFKTNENSKQKISFATARSIPVNGKIVITFPDGYNVSGANFDYWSGIDGGRSISINGQVITITRDGTGTIAIYGTKVIRLNNIINPSTAGTYTILLKTTDSIGTNIDVSLPSSNILIQDTITTYDPSSPWPTFAHDNQRTGQTSKLGPDYPTLKIKSDPVGASYGSIGIDGDGNTYQSGDIWSGWYYPSHAWKTNSSGQIVWNYTSDSSKAWAGPILTNTGQVIVSQSQDTSCTNSRFKSLNKDTGALIWSSFDGDWYGDHCGWAAAGTILSGGVLFSEGHGAGNFWINPIDGSYLNNGGGAGYNVVGSPAMSNDESKVYFSGAGIVRAYEKDGTFLWTRNLKTFAEGETNSVAVTTNGNVLMPLQNGILYALNPADGTTSWSFNSSSLFRSKASTATDGTIYIASKDGKIHALNQNGIEQWSYQGTAGYYDGFIQENSVSIDGTGNIYSILDDTYSLNSSGQFRWKIKNGPTQPEVTIGDNKKIYVKAGYSVLTYEPWTISATDNLFGKSGGSITITTTSSMLKKDPSASEDNQVQAVMANGDKVPLTYVSTDSNGNSLWSGTWNVPEVTLPGEYTATIEASSYKVETNVAVNFTTVSTGSSNTGIKTTLNYKIENVAPTGSISINNGATYTNSANVNLTLTGSDNLSGVSSMMISEDSNFTSSSWEPFSTTKAFILSSVDGTKNIYMKLKDNAGNISSIYEDSIILDTLAPSPVVITKTGRITKIPNLDLLSYYYIGTSLVIVGTGEAKAIVYFSYDGKVNTSIVDDSNKYTLEFSLSTKTDKHLIEYYQKDLSGLVSLTRTLNLITDCEKNFPDSLKEKYCPSTIEITSSSSSSSSSTTSSQSASSSSSSSSSSSVSKIEENITVKFLSENKEPYINSKVIIDGREYLTDKEGEVTIPKQSGKYTAKILSNTGDILGEFSFDNSNKVITVEMKNITSQPFPYIYILIFILLSIVIVIFILLKRKNNYSNNNS